MEYHITRTKLFISRFFGRILDFFDAVSFYTRKIIHSVKNHERTQIAGYHIKKASRKIISTNMENTRDWNRRLASSESFRIEDEDV